MVHKTSFKTGMHRMTLIGLNETILSNKIIKLLHFSSPKETLSSLLYIGPSSHGVNLFLVKNPYTPCRILSSE